MNVRGHRGLTYRMGNPVRTIQIGRDPLRSDLITKSERLENTNFA